MKTITKLFFTGLATILPITITIYVLYWLGSTAESIFGPPLKMVMPTKYYHAGLGVAAGLVMVVIIGILMKAYVFRAFIGLSERILRKIPLVKTLYSSVRDLMSFFASEERPAMKPVMVTLGNTNMHVIGFVTRESFADLPAGIGGSDTVAVFLPMSYQMGGFTTMVPRDAVRPIDMTIEQAMRFAITAGVAGAKGS